MPGYIRDSLNISVYTNNDSNIQLTTETIAYRQFTDMSNNISFDRICNMNTTHLVANL